MKYLRVNFPRFRHVAVPPLAVVTICLASTGIMSTFGWWVVLRESGEPPPRSTLTAEFVSAQTQMRANWRVYRNANSKMHERGYAEEPLPKGEEMPPLAGPGWINDSPPDADKLSGKVVVLDVWDGLCPNCALSRPGLLRVNEKYRDRGVIFLGMTSADNDDARGYIQEAQLPWPNAYGAGDTIDVLKANAPTLFVVGADGRVAWNDDRARYRHDAADLETKLELAIDEALAASLAQPTE
jgi:thiol-disulfide isomerase/thioredoxin